MTVENGKITGPGTREFLQQWNDGTPYITAHTSGSTGAPKEIKLSKEDMWQSALATNRYMGIDATSVLACPLSASYIAGKMMIVRALAAGCKLAMIEPSNSFDLSTDGRPLPCVDLLAIVPSQVTNPKLQHANIRNIIVGGAPLDAAQEQTLRSLDARCYATYGMTETCSHVALRDITAGDTRFKAIGGYSFTTDAACRLVIHSASMSWKQLTTNDIVELHDSCTFTWKGRHDNVIITGALKVHPEELERRIAHLIQRPFIVKGVPHERWGQTVALVIEGETYDTAMLESSLKAMLKPHELPRTIIFTPQLARTSSGKLKH